MSQAAPPGESPIGPSESARRGGSHATDARTQPTEPGARHGELPNAPQTEAIANDIVPTAIADEAAPTAVLGHVPLDASGLSLVVLAVLASVFALHWAAAVFVPLMFSLLLVYALSPVVDAMVRLRLPRALAAAGLLLALGGGLGWTAYSLSDSASRLVDSLPLATQKLRAAILTKSAKASPLDTVQAAAAQLERAAQENAAQPSMPRRGVQRVIVERPPFNIRDYLWTGTVGVLGAATQLTLVAFLTFFALSAGDTFRRKLVKMTGPSLQKKRITVHVLDDITQQIQRYLLVQIITSAVVGVATGLAFWAIGLENAAVWGILAGVTNLIPYVGSVLVLSGAGLVAFLQFSSIEMALLVAGSSLAVRTFTGNLLGPWLTSRASRMNPVAVFVGVIFWGWLWGVWGLLLGIPILMVVKAICDRVEGLQRIGELLGD